MEPHPASCSTRPSAGRQQTLTPGHRARPVESSSHIQYSDGSSHRWARSRSQSAYPRGQTIRRSAFASTAIQARGMRRYYLIAPLVNPRWMKRCNKRATMLNGRNELTPMAATFHQPMLAALLS